MRFSLTSLSCAVVALSSALSSQALPTVAERAYDQGEWVQHDKRAQLQPHVGNRAYKTTRGVNLGGWFVLEAWMMPSFFTPDLTNAGAIDQWTYMTAVNNNTRALQLLQQHWSTWINETDFMAISAAGLNTVRIPVGHWTFSGSNLEPYLVGAELPYLKQAILWASKYSIDVILDLHTAPNSQNGFDNSGHQGPTNFGTVTPSDNAARVYSALQSMVTTFVNDKTYGGIVKGIEILNEPACYTLGQTYMTQVHQTGECILLRVDRKGELMVILSTAYQAIKSSVSSSALTFPTIIIHDCFASSLSNWYSTYSNTTAWTPGSYAVDTHRYTAFDPQATALGNNQTAHINYICGMQSEFADAYTHFPVITGEWSLAVACTDCSYSTMAQSVASQNTQQQNLFYRQFFEAQVVTYEQAGGWVYWCVYEF
jgi:glucan 1,3-beta-glucosidase